MRQLVIQGLRPKLWRDAKIHRPVILEAPTKPAVIGESNAKATTAAMTRGDDAVVRNQLAEMQR